MKDQELILKIVRETPMTASESLELDELLEAQVTSAPLVGALHDPEPSLSWRSALNEELLKCSVKPKRRSVTFWVSGFAATAVAVLALFVFMPHAPKVDRTAISTAPLAKQTGPSLEESLVSAHHEADLETGMGVSWTPEPNSSRPDSL